jgi:hypothetical protein
MSRAMRAILALWAWNFCLYEASLRGLHYVAVLAAFYLSQTVVRL